ncbi:MAG: methylmalonyl Co-A mutase-associated GTPase MeaB [Geminicoccaceae bacterium]|nr:methylmalonyl Co-A mutase-associated GTPase MeaB [Geminicoccaceae bacterium]
MTVRARKPLDVEALERAVRAGERAGLSRAITLVESARADHRQTAQELLDRLLPFSGGAQRIGVTGVPGVGKSTFVDAFGHMLTSAGHKLAVLAIDPSSSRTGGSILGDKTRMPRLAVDPHSFVRPSPTSGALGGVARMTRETMLLCEAAGFDVVLVETVGVGQSETAVADMVDIFLALMLPGAGDDLQGIKKGLLELADVIAVNKADGDHRLQAEQAASHYRRALNIVEPTDPVWRPPVLTLSAREETGLTELWKVVQDHRRALEESGGRERRRRAQQVRWMWSMLEACLHDRLRRDRRQRETVAEVERAVARGRMLPTRAVDTLLALL